MLEAIKGISRCIFEKKYEHFLLFRYEDEDGKLMYRETFRTVADAQSGIMEGVKIYWGELISEVDTNQTRTEINQEKINSIMGLRHE